jgi:hypothetical protein
MTYHPGCVVFDIDGTLASIEHRRHFVRSKPKNWMAFRRGMAHDLPCHDIIWLLKTMKAAGCTVLVASGRGEEDREVTETWLRDVAGVEGLYERLYMRAEQDYRSDDVVKGEILDQMIADGFQPTIAVDDRNQVVDMWRARGLRCLQVAPGDF